MIVKSQILGKLIKSADDLHLFYYERKDSIKSCPSILVGSSLIKLISRNPKKGIEVLNKKINPFLIFLKSKIIKNPEKEKLAKYKIKSFNSIMETIIDCSIDEDEKPLNKIEINEMFFNYLQY